MHMHMHMHMIWSWDICSVPIWCSHKGIGGRGNGRRAKISQFHLAWFCQQDIACLDVSVGDKGKRRGDYSFQTHAAVTTLSVVTRRTRRTPHTAGGQGLPVNHVVGVKISQALQSTVRDRSYLHFLEGLLVDWMEKVGQWADEALWGRICDLRLYLWFEAVTVIWDCNCVTGLCN